MNEGQSERKKILMIVGSLGAGGKERQLITLLRGLQESGEYSTRVAVLNPNGLRELEASKYADQIIPIKRVFRFDVVIPLLYLVSLVKKEQIQIIHTWGSGIWDLTGLIVAWSCQVPFLHGGIRSAPSVLSFSDRLSRWSALRANAIVANSKAGLKSFGVDQDPRSQVIYNGIDMTRFEGLTNAAQGHSLCMVANFSDKKDQRSLVLALECIMKIIPDVYLTLVGHDAGTLEAVIACADELGLKGHIEFVTDTLFPEPYIAKSQIGILATNETKHGEGTANALLEYMALSKPVVVTDNGGNKEVIIDGKTGWLVPPGQPDAIAEKVIALFQNPEMANQMGIAGRKRVEEKFTIVRMVSAYKALYSSLIMQNK